MPDIFKKIEDFLEHRREIEGDAIFLDDNYGVEKSKGSVNLYEDEKPPDLFTKEPDWKKSRTLDELYDKIHTCKNCPLGETRKKFVFGAGNPNADIMVVGEAPGRNEDDEGKPFVGRAGQLLTKILAAINLSREEVFIANIIKCRPPDNRRPTPTEVDECEPYLIKQIELIKPKFVIALGLTALDSLLKKSHKMGEMRGKILDYKGIPMLVTYHPAFLLRSPKSKRQVWEDVQKLRKMYDDYLESGK